MYRMICTYLTPLGEIVIYKEHVRLMRSYNAYLYCGVY